MKILILGSGLLGVTTAYVLASRGHQVEILERQGKSGAETSYANGGQLSYSHAEPWANPGVLLKLPQWFLRGEESPLKFRLRADPAMIRWGLQFLRNCTTARAKQNCINMLRLGLYSRVKMQQLVKEAGISFDYSERGIVHIYGTQQDLDQAVHHAEFQARYGCDEKPLTREQVLALEPALKDTSRTIVGGIHAHLDGNGDAHEYCVQLTKLVQEKYGVKVHYGVNIEGIETEGETITGVRTDKGNYTGDAYVVALGSYSPLYLHPLGIRLPIYPMKGYSITVPANGGSPAISITDGTHKIVLSRLGDRLRVAGTAEFAGYDRVVVESRIAPIVKAARALLPKAHWDGEIATWACLRPSTPDGAPILGRTPYKGLYLNTGHGTLGWTQAAGSAYIVADIIENRTPEITLGGLTMETR